MLLVFHLNFQNQRKNERTVPEKGRKTTTNDKKRARKGAATHVGAEDSADRVARENHRDAVLVALLVERGRVVVVVRERRVAETPSHLRWFLGPAVDISTPGRVVQDDARAGEIRRV